MKPLWPPRSNERIFYGKRTCTPKSIKGKEREDVSKVLIPDSGLKESPKFVSIDEVSLKFLFTKRDRCQSQSKRFGCGRNFVKRTSRKEHIFLVHPNILPRSR